ncbi:DUF2878 domain-containing protein [Burkholderiaceae bacterium DAT-1]|nr:DUF2878 domain-containing protein [Burkholderiaceae bacterium DAT-1]
MTPPYPVLNALAYQCAWLATVMSAANGHGWYTMPIALAQVGWHLARSEQVRSETGLLLCISGAGLMLDQMVLGTGWIQFTGDANASDRVPLWMAGIWLSFATTFNGALAWLQRRYWLAIGLAGLGGPLAYWAAARMGALVIVDLQATCLAYGMGFALLVPAGLAGASFLQQRPGHASASHAEHTQ